MTKTPLGLWEIVRLGRQSASQDDAPSRRLKSLHVARTPTVSWNRVVDSCAVQGFTVAKGCLNEHSEANPDSVGPLALSSLALIKSLQGAEKIESASVQSTKLEDRLSRAVKNAMQTGARITGRRWT